MQIHKVLVAIALAMTVVACAGTKFDRVQNNELVLNSTTEQQITSNLGRPGSVTTSIQNEKKIRHIVYSYATSLTAPGVVAGVPSSRAQSFSFFDNKLVGYQYISNFLADRTDFDEAAVLSFKEGVTTRADVIQKLGEPTGQSVYPLVDDKADRAIGYSYSFVDTRPATIVIERQSLTIVFGPDEVAKKITYTKSGRT